MERFKNLLKELRTKLEQLRKMDLNETSTRTIIIDPILEALGWDVRDPKVVRLEYPTIDGKSVDYALEINENPVLLVEAKPLGDGLGDVKAITQVVGYAANGGIEWCILTNGVIWRIYRSSEKCPAPDKLLLEINYDPSVVSDEKLPSVIEDFHKFSRDEMAKGTLDSEGERVFNDSKIRKVFDIIMQNPPRALINIIRKELADSPLSNQKIKESLFRIWNFEEPPIQIKREKGKKTKPRFDVFDENFHFNGKSPNILELYREIDRFCLDLISGSIQKTVRQKAISYKYDKTIFCSAVIIKSGLRIYLKLNYNELEDPPTFARDVSQVGHWGVGDVEMAIDKSSQLPEAFNLIRRSLENVRKNK